MLPPRSSLRTSLKEVLAGKIVRGEFAAGTPINIAELAGNAGVSVTPLREALIELEGDGLVESILNRGYFVRALDEGEMRELYPIVAALEVLALRSGPPSPASLALLDEINDRLRRERSPTRRIDLDGRWHTTLLRDCGNASLLRLLAALKHRIYRYEYAFMSDASQSPQSVKEHDDIARAVRGRRIERAAALLEQNWTLTPARLAAITRLGSRKR